MRDSTFVPCEFLGGPGEEGERIMWEAVVHAYQGDDQVIGCLNYTTYDAERQIRYQPDILLASPDLGIAIIEVKTFGIDKIVGISGNRWRMRNFYKDFIDPFRQGEQQVRQLLRQFTRLNKGVEGPKGRVIIALPLITRHEWMERGFDPDHHACPPLIFGDELTPRNIRLSIEDNATIICQGKASAIGDRQWMRMKEFILGHPKVVAGHRDHQDKGDAQITDPSAVSSMVLRKKTRRQAVDQLADWMGEIDKQQARIGMQIPPGPQRIRGIAGSGKTVLLCQKAARMHIQHPEWRIALVFFTRSLYELIPAEVNKWLRFLSGEENDFDLVNGNLKVLHAWGSKGRAGFYSILRNRANLNALVSEKQEGNPQELLAKASRRLLEDATIDQIYDAVLIDEGQDISVDEEFKHKDKQAIYWLAWQALKPVRAEQPNVRRLIWAYDEAQSLNSLRIPSYKEVFGKELADVLSGQLSGPTYAGGISKSEVMRRCYRTPGPIITAAHGLGMGLLRLQGLISGYTVKDEWRDIGYVVNEGNFTKPGNRVVLERPAKNSPNPITQLWNQPVIGFQSFGTDEAQLDALVDEIRMNTDVEGLSLCRDQLIILIGHDENTDNGPQDVIPRSLGGLRSRVAIHLQQAGINFYVPGCLRDNTIGKEGGNSPDQFWYDDAITITSTYFAKGHQSHYVYVLGLENLAEDEASVRLRNQLFVALSRSTAWASMSGITDPKTGAEYVLYEEIRRVLAAQNKFEFIYRRPPRRAMGLDV